MSRPTGAARQFVQPHQCVLATDPIAYWLLDEKTGAVAYDWVSGRIAGAQNGAHVGVTLGQDGIGDGRTSPLYDGANDFTNIYSIPFAGAFSPTEGTAAIWAKVSGAGVWTDGAQRTTIRFAVNASNYIEIIKAVANNQLSWTYRAGAVSDVVHLAGLTTVDWMHLVLTWSKPDDEVIAYYAGLQTGAIQNGLGVWAGALANWATVIGAGTTVPGTLWSGYNAHGAVWDRPLSAAEIDQQYRARWA